MLKRYIIFFNLVLFFLLFVFVARQPVRSQDFRTDKEGLSSYLHDIAGEDPLAQEAAIKALAEKGDPDSVPILNALYEGSLYIWFRTEEDKHIILLKMAQRPDGEEIGYLSDPLTSETLKEWDDIEDELEMVSVQSPEGRRWLQIALDGLKLFDPSETVRRSAAVKMGNRGDPSALSLLVQARSKEGDKWVRHSIEEAIAQLHLADSDPVVRREAAARLGEIKGLEALPHLQSLLNEEPSETDESVRKEIQEAIERIEDYQYLEQIIGTIFSGLSLGSILLLMGLGLAITFGQMGVINMAHGEMMMIGAYTTFVLQELFTNYFSPSMHSLYFLAALPLSFSVTALFGLLLEKSVIRFLYGKPLDTLLATWGVSIILQQAARWYFGDLTSVNAPNWMRGGVQAMVGLVLPYNRIFIIVLSIVGLLGVRLLLFQTRWGLKVRAVTQNRNMSACLGISTRKVDGWTFALGAGLAGLAGCALSLVGNVDPEMGRTYIVDSFMVVVVGGVGKLAGTVTSALGIGMVNKILEPLIGGTGGAIYAKIFILVAIIAFLQRKPSGLFPAKGRAAEAP